MCIFIKEKYVFELKFEENIGINYSGINYREIIFNETLI